MADPSPTRCRPLSAPAVQPTSWQSPARTFHFSWGWRGSSSGAARTKRRMSAWLALLVILLVVVYTIFTGASPSVVRAAIMGSVLLLGPVVGRRYDPTAALAVSAALMIALDPNLLADRGLPARFLADAWHCPSVPCYPPLFAQISNAPLARLPPLRRPWCSSRNVARGRSHRGAGLFGCPFRHPYSRFCPPSSHDRRYRHPSRGRIRALCRRSTRPAGVAVRLVARDQCSALVRAPLGGCGCQRGNRALRWPVLVALFAFALGLSNRSRILRIVRRGWAFAGSADYVGTTLRRCRRHRLDRCPLCATFLATCPGPQNS